MNCLIIIHFFTLHTKGFFHSFSLWMIDCKACANMRDHQWMHKEGSSHFFCVCESDALCDDVNLYNAMLPLVIINCSSLFCCNKRMSVAIGHYQLSSFFCGALTFILRAFCTKLEMGNISRYLRFLHKLTSYYNLANFPKMVW